MPFLPHPRNAFDLNESFFFNCVFIFNMSLSDYLDLSLCDPSPPTDDDSSIEQFLGPLLHWSTGTESAGSASNNVNVLEPERCRSTTPRNLDEPTVWVSDLIEPSGLFPPLPSDVIPDVLKPSPHVNVFSPKDDDLECVLLSFALQIHLNISPLVYVSRRTTPTIQRKLHRPSSKDVLPLFQSLESGRVIPLSLRLKPLIARDFLRGTVQPLEKRSVSIALSGSRPAKLQLV
jgi:hypothetical protein